MNTDGDGYPNLFILIVTKIIAEGLLFTCPEQIKFTNIEKSEQINYSAKIFKIRFINFQVKFKFLFKISTPEMVL